MGARRPTIPLNVNRRRRPGAGAAWVAFAAALLLAATLVHANPNPRALVEQTTERVMAVLDERGEELADDPVALYEAMAPIVQEHIDFERISARILGPAWRDADADTRERFIREFQRSLLRTYGGALDDYRGFEATVRGTRQRGDAVQVGMDIRRGDTSARVIYYLEERADGWKLVDISAEGVSLVHNFREDFRARLRDQSLESIIDTMERRNREIGFE